MLLLLAVVLGAAASAQPVGGDVQAMGFQASGGFVFRSGQWFPILVRLTSQGSEIFSGQLQARVVDLDGDRVAFTHPATVGPDVGGAGKRFWCYAVANERGELPEHVDVIDENGALVAKLPTPRCDCILNDDLLVLDVSEKRISKLNLLETPQWGPGQAGEGHRPYYRNVVVTTLPNGARDLPDRWWGLEAVDVVVWDQPSPAAIDTWQVGALVEWVRNGGQLIVGVGATWDAIRGSELASIMPLRGAGPTAELNKLTVFFNTMALPAWRERGLKNPIAVTTAEPAPDALRTLGEHGPSGPLAMITMHPVGSGRVVATAASLNDLTRSPIDVEKFFGALIDLNAYTDKFRENQMSSAQLALGGSNWIYDDIVSPVGFGGETALRGLTAFLFVAAYVGLATVGAWWWLGNRKLTHASWVVFAGFAIAASVLSLGTVAALRGFSRGVQSLSILDLEAGSVTARGPCLFGYRSPIRQTVELSLPGEGNFLRPLARESRTKNYYVTPARYAGMPARAALDGVLMRATLKQVEGFWHGELAGSVRGDLVVKRENARLTPGSWLLNDFDTDLEGGYLLFIDPRHDNAGLGVPYRAAGLTTLYDHPTPAHVVPPAVNILAVQVPRIPAGERIGGLGAAHYAQVDQQWVQWYENWQRRGASNDKRRKEKRAAMPDLRTLHELQQAWSGRNNSYGHLRAGLSATLQAVLLASTRSYYLHNDRQSYESVTLPLSTDGVCDLDLTHWLCQGQAVLICWADEPGPAVLQRNGKPLRAYGGLTVYRVRIPIAYEGRPPRLPEEPGL